MRKAALLLAALGIMTAAYAEQPKLTVTNISQEIEIENQAGGADFDDVFFWNYVGLKYDDWSFGLKAAKRWSVDLDDGIHSTKSRMMLDAWKKVSDNLKLGVRYRNETSYDRYVLRYDYNNGLLWSAGDFWYQANNTEGHASTDNYEMEWFPIGVQYGPLKVGYFVNGILFVGDVNYNSNGYGNMESYLEHQIRAYLTLYKGEKLTLSAEGRFTLHHDSDYADNKAGKAQVYRVYDDFGRNRVYLGADYKVNENLNVYAKYGYEFRDWKYEDGTEREFLDQKGNRSQENYQNIIVGWNYKF